MSLLANLASFFLGVCVGMGIVISIAIRISEDVAKQNRENMDDAMVVVDAAREIVATLADGDEKKPRNPLDMVGESVLPEKRKT